MAGEIFSHFSLFTSHFYTRMQDVAPSAVRIALAIDTIICTINFVVSFLVIASQKFNG